MALINCPECGKEISDSSEKCIHCGYPLKPVAVNEKKRGPKVVIIVLAVLLIVAIAVIIGFAISRGGAKKETCKADGCIKTVYSNGYCIEHYGDQRSGNEVITTQVPGKTDSTTSSEPIEEDVEEVVSFSKNSTVKSESCEFTMTGYSIASKIEPKNCTSTYYHYYEASSGNVFVDVKFKIKNLRKTSVDQNAVVTSVKVFYDGDYEYICSAVTVDKDGDFEGYTSLYSIGALETMEYHMLAEVPREVKSSSKGLKVQVVVDGTTYECTLR